MAPLRCAAKFDPFLSLVCAPTPSTLAQSKERKGSNFVICQPCDQDQRICIRPERGYCTIGYAAAAIDPGFGISGTNAATPLESK